MPKFFISRPLFAAVVLSVSVWSLFAETHSRPSTTFAFAGDVMMGTSYPDDSRGAYLPKNDGRDLFVECADIFRGADVAAANLEGVLIDTGGKAKLCSNPATCFTFRMPVRYVRNLVDAGIDFMSVANNHANDFGSIGKKSTQLALRKAGIAYAGQTGMCESAVIVRNGKKIGFAAFGHSRGTMSINDLTLVKEVVGRLDKECDIVVVSFHGGEEGVKHTRVPFAAEHAFGERRGDVHEFAHAAVDAGADIVYGHGPHVTRAMELYRNRLIMYSLGNFCTPYRMNINGLTGHAPLVTLSVDSVGQFLSGKIHPFIQQKGIGPRPDTSGVVVGNIRRLSQLDFPRSPLRIDADGTLSITPSN